MSRAEELSVQNVSKQFGGVVALSSVSLNAHPAEITGLIGPNGAGKTTLFNIITGCMRADSGEIRYGESNLSGRSPETIARLGVVRTFQDVRIFEKMTVLENIEVGVRRGTSLEPAFEMLADVARIRGWGIPLNAPVESLSFGDQKIVAMARCLVVGSSALLLDEPASGLDETGLEVLRVLLDGFRATGRLILLVEHNMSLVMEVCDRLYVLASGTLLAQGTPSEIRTNRQVIDTYLGVASEEGLEADL